MDGCAPPPEHETVPFTHNKEDAPSSLDVYAFKWKAVVVVFVIVAELSAYISLMVYYATHCETSTAAMTCFEATTFSWLSAWLLSLQ